MENRSKTEYEMFTTVLLRNHITGVIVDRMGSDYVIDIGHNETDWDTINVKPEDIVCAVDCEKGLNYEENHFCPVYKRMIDWQSGLFYGLKRRCS